MPMKLVTMSSLVSPQIQFSALMCIFFGHPPFYHRWTSFQSFHAQTDCSCRYLRFILLVSCHCSRVLINFDKILPRSPIYPSVPGLPTGHTPAKRPCRWSCWPCPSCMVYHLLGLVYTIADCCQSKVCELCCIVFLSDSTWPVKRNFAVVKFVRCCIVLSMQTTNCRKWQGFDTGCSFSYFQWLCKRPARASINLCPLIIANV